jgi:alanyl-tRNA synthetase
MPVSERLYYSDPFLKTFSAAVTDVREVARQDGESVWQVALDRTAFYPTSGGQPFDTGTLRATSRGGAALDVAVEAVEEDDAGEVWHSIRKPLSAGTQVEAAIDWERRFDHMQQHTGQHLVSALFLAQHNAPTVSFHLGDTVSTIDLATASVSPHVLEKVEGAANRIVGEDRPVSIRSVARAEAEAMLAAGTLRKLPEREGEIRLIEIADCDSNACGGTHVRSTGQIGGVLLRGVEKVSRGYRVEFVCGLRAVRVARADAAILAQLTASLSAGTPDIPAAVDRLRAEARSGAKERQRLREELADYHAVRLAVEVPIENGVRLVDRCWKDRDREYIRLLASRLTAAAPETAAILSTEDGATVRVILARSLDLDFDCGKMLKEALARFGLRGGGSSDLAQGDIATQDAPALRAALVRTIRASTQP